MEIANLSQSNGDLYLMHTLWQLYGEGDTEQAISYLKKAQVTAKEGEPVGGTLYWDDCVTL